MNIDKVWGMVITVLLAVMGGIARILNLKDKKKLKWALIFSEIFISGFIGIIVYLITSELGASGNWTAVLCGMGGWIGPKVIDLLAAKFFSEKLGVDASKKDAENK